MGSESEGLALFRNEGSRSAPTLVRDTSFAAEVPLLAAPAAGDIDGDGVVDLVVGGAGGGLVYLKMSP